MTGSGRAVPVLPRSAMARAFWLTVGLLAVGIGAIGIVVPGLPTTGFFIVAAWCFGRSNPRFEQWVLGLPHIGPLVRDHRAGLGMPRRAKRLAITMMWAAIAVSALTLRRQPTVLVACIVALGLGGTAYLLRRVPTREHVLAAQGPAT